MTSVILNNIGLGNIDPAYIYIGLIALFLILLFIILGQGLKLSRLTKKYNRFMEGRNGRNMEEEILSLFDDLKALKRAQRNDADEIKLIQKNLVFAYQKVGIVRYDAFKEMGGKLSFSICLLNDMNCGFIINSVHSSDGCYTYTKQIVDGASKITLGDEEKKALQKALSIDTHPTVSQAASEVQIKRPEDKRDAEIDEIIENKVNSSKKSRALDADLSDEEFSKASDYRSSDYAEDDTLEYDDDYEYDDEEYETDEDYEDLDDEESEYDEDFLEEL